MSLRLGALVVTVALGAACSPVGVEITSPTHGDIVDQSSIVVTGTTSEFDPNWMVEVNGTPAVVEKSEQGLAHWSVVLPVESDKVLNPIEAELRLRSNPSKLVGRDRVVIVAGQKQAPGARAPQGFALRVNDTLLDQVEVMLKDNVHFRLDEVAPSGTKVLSKFCYADSFLGCLGRINVHITDAPTIADFGVDLDAQQDALYGSATLDGFSVGAQVKSDIGLPFNCRIELGAGQVGVGGSLSIEGPGEAGGPFMVEQVGDIAVSLNGFGTSTDCAGFLGGLVGPVLDLFEDQVASLVVDNLEGLLNERDANGSTLITRPVESLMNQPELQHGLMGGTTLGGSGIALSGALADVLQDQDGLTVALALGAEANIGTGKGACDPDVGAPALHGSLYVPATLPKMTALSPALGLPYDAALTVSVSALNQLATAATECGYVDFEVTDFDGFAVDGAFLAEGIEAFHKVPPTRRYQLRFRATMAPLFTGMPGPEGEPLDLRLGQFVLDLNRASGSGRITDLSIAIDLRVGAAFEFDDRGRPTVSLGAITAQNMTLSVMANRYQADEDQVLEFFGSLLPLALQLVAGDIDLGDVPSVRTLGLAHVETLAADGVLSFYMQGDFVAQGLPATVDDRFAFVGDSIFGLFRGAQAEVARHAGSRFVDMSRGGARLAKDVYSPPFIDAPALAKQYAAARSPLLRTLIMNGGGNDVLFDCPDEERPLCEDFIAVEVVPRLSELWEEARADGVEHILYMGLYHLPSWGMGAALSEVIDPATEVLAEAAAHHDVIFIDPRATFDQHPEYLFVDGLHPSPAGAQALGEMIWLVITEHDLLP